MGEVSLRLVFMGTPTFAVSTLDGLLNIGHEVVAVYTQPDRRSGRGRRIRDAPVKSFAQERGLPVFQPTSLRRDIEARSSLEDLSPDAIIVAAYGLFLPKEALSVPRLGCLNIHPSLLPRHRGPSPVVTAVRDGDLTTGVSIMLLDEGLDTGPVLAQREVSIGDEETAEELTVRLFDLGARLLVSTLDGWNAGRLTPAPQDDRLATVTRLLEREDGRLDWDKPAEMLAREVRAYTPWPGTFTTWEGRVLKVLRARSEDTSRAGSPGTVVGLDGARLGVVAGRGTLELLAVQVEGRRAADAAEFVRGYPGFIGATLGT